MDYRYEATTSTGFIQQLTSCYLPHGYWFYVGGYVPDRKQPGDVDAKLLDKYGIAISRSSRARRKQAGKANVHYLRHGRFFVLLATHGHHSFYADEAKNIRDMRRAPIIFNGYSVSVKRGNYLRRMNGETITIRDGKWRVRVQISKETFRDLKAYFVSIATRRSAEQLGRELYCLPFEPYARVRQQMLDIIRIVNQRRKAARMEPVSPKVLRYRRRIVRPFEPVDSGMISENTDLSMEVLQDEGEPLQ